LASGDVLVFVDSDVEVQCSTLAQIAESFSTADALDALFGSYDDAPAAHSFLSQYKNLQHHYVHQRSNMSASTFWSGCGAIRRPAFEAVGGFDESYLRPSVEDIELGYRLCQSGYNIRNERTLQVKHLKRWRPVPFIISEVRDRAIPWSDLVWRTSILPNELNVAASQRLSGAASLLGWIALVASWRRARYLLPAALCYSLIMVLNRDFYLFLTRRKGPSFAAAALPLHVSYFFYSTVVFLAVGLCHLLVRRPWRRASYRSKMCGGTIPLDNNMSMRSLATGD
jgi:hypothetical protein